MSGDSISSCFKMRRYFAAAVVGIMGVSASILMAVVVNHLEQDKVEENFDHHSEEYVSLIYNRLTTHLAVLDTLAVFFAASEKVERHEFEVFTTPIFSHYPSIKALYWVPRISLAERAVYEKEAQVDFPGFQFTELNPQGEWIPVKSRSEYFPIYYLNTHQASKKAVLGFDLASDPKRLQAIIQSRDSGRTTMTQPLKSLQFKTDHLESLVFIPVYDTKNQVPDTLEQRRQHLQGFVLGDFLVADIVADVLYSVDMDEIDLQIEDLFAPPNERLLYSSSKRSLHPESFHKVHQREVASRHWSFEVTLAPPLRWEQNRWLPLISLSAGLTLTGLMVTYLLILINRTILLKGEVYQRKMVETELQTAKQYAELMTQAKSDFLGSLSQDMRLPLNNILDTTQSLLDSPLTSQQRQQIKLLGISTDSLLRLINDISDISEIEAGKLELEQKPFYILETIQRVIILSRREAEEKRLVLNLRAHHTLPTYVSGDSHRFQQILTHLINNAIRFTLSGGSILIEVKAEFQDSTEVILHTAIIDSGVGIEPERHEQLFGKFDQLESSALQHFNEIGGLGLVICRRLVEKMGGKIGVISKKGQGATFWFSLPLMLSDESEPPPTTEELSALDLHPLRILLVEDNATNRMVTCLMLRKMGCQQIEIAQNGEEAVAMTATTRYDLVLMDIHMPVMDGLCATQLIRQREHTEHQEHSLIVALTADTTSESREACFFAGTDDYLTKPFCQKELLSTLYRWLYP